MADIPLRMTLQDWLALLDAANGDSDVGGVVRRSAGLTRPGEVKRGTTGDDTVLGGRDDDTLKGLGGDDRLVGRGGDDRLIGGGGADFIVGGGGADTLRGGGGDDDLRGGGGADNIKSGGGDDRIKAGGGADLTNGGGGDDNINAGGGADTLIGNRGSDTLKGGGGADIFQFAARDLAGGAIDVIRDLGRGADRIDLSRFASAASLDDLSFGRLNGDVTIDIGAGRIRLAGVTDEAALTASQFIFFGQSTSPSTTDPTTTTPTTTTTPGTSTTPTTPTTPPPVSLDDNRVGGDGDDVIPTGAGTDTLTGGAGADVFDIQLEAGQIDENPDRVADFSYAAGDRIGVSAALDGISFDTLTDVVRATPVGANTEIAIDRGAGFQTVLVLEGVSFTTEDLAAYGFDATPRVSAGFALNPYGFQNNNAAVADPDATRDGKFVAFADQTNPDGAPDDVDVTDSTNEFDADLDIFVRNTETGFLTRASVDGNGATLKRQDGSGADSHAPALSADGRVIAFATNGVGAASDQNDEGDVYIRDLFNDGAPVLVSVGANGLAAGGVADPSFAADSTGIVAISADGRKVAFVSSADITGANQVDVNGAHDVYLRDLDAGTTTLISTATGGTTAQGVREPYSTFGDILAMSDDGRYIAFLTATAIATTDFGNLLDVYLKDTATGQTLHVTDGFETGVFGFDMSADGSRIAFLTDFAATGDTNGLQDVYVADIDLASFTVANAFRASLAADGGQINGEDAESPVIAPDGSRIAWVTAAEDVAFFDPAGPADDGDRVFVRDLTTGVVSAPVGPTPDNAFFDSDYAVFTDDTLVYRKEVAAAGGGSRPVSETFATDGLTPVPLPEISSQGLTTTQELSFFTTIRSSLETTGDTDVFRLFQRPGLANLRIEATGVDGGGGTLADPILNLYFNQVDGTPEITIDDFITRDARIDISLNNQLVFVEVEGFGGATGTYSLSIEPI